MDQNQKQQAVEQLRNAGTVLITTVSSPTTDQLTASLGLAQMLKKMGKNVSTVITSTIPDYLKFLKAEKSFEDNLDSLRDFILSLDKNLADKLRYKVEGDEVRIFITPYHTKIAKEDVRFSQGDFNVDAVVVVGAVNRADVDQAVMSQSRVLNETPVIAVTAGSAQSTIGGTNWHDPQASSISEMMVSASEALQPGLLDEQSSNSLLTGIIAATDHFSNPDTSPKVMTMAAQLMASGADQQMIMRELKSLVSPTAGKSIAESKDDDKPKDLSSDEPKKLEDDMSDDNKTSSQDHNMKVSHDDISSEGSTDSNKKDELPNLGEQHVSPQPNQPTPAFNNPTPPQLINDEPARPEEPQHLVSTPPAPSSGGNSDSDTFQVPTPPAPAEATLPSTPANTQSQAQQSPTNTDASSDNKTLDNARAAVEAAMASQPSGTAMNPVQSMGAHEFTDNRVPSPPQLTDNQPPQQTPLPPSPSPQQPQNPSVQPPDQTGATGVVGSVSPSQLYPNVDSPYNSQN